MPEAFNDRDTIALILSKSRIPVRKLKSLPLLRTCNDWNRIQPLGLVNHKSLIAAWNGVLVELDHQLYFVRKETLAALHDRISWQFPRTITVVE